MRPRQRDKDPTNFSDVEIFANHSNPSETEFARSGHLHVVGSNRGHRHAPNTIRGPNAKNSGPKEFIREAQGEVVEELLRMCISESLRKCLAEECQVKAKVPVAPLDTR
ncbi:hypothetical protein CR513_10711, partial [Mucuna pruriens]